MSSRQLATVAQCSDLAPRSAMVPRQDTVRTSIKRGVLSTCCTGSSCSDDLGCASKRCRQFASGQQPGWQSKTLGSLRRVQSAPLEAEAIDQEVFNDLEYWRSKEDPHRRCPFLMGQVQTDVSAPMRSVLVDWLGEVRDEFRLGSETLFLAVSYLDAYLCAEAVPRGSFQLLGLACLWLAAKMEEVHPPCADQVLAMAERVYSGAQLRDMEAKVLFTLQFRLGVPTCYRFLHLLLQLAPLPPHPDSAASVRRLAEALLELSLLDTDFSAQPPSATAAAAAYLAMGMVRHHSAGLQAVARLSGADAGGLGVLVQKLARLLCDRVGGGQFCALAEAYVRWEGAHGTAALGVAAATAAGVPTGSQPWGPGPGPASAPPTAPTAPTTTHEPALAPVPAATSAPAQAHAPGGASASRPEPAAPAPATGGARVQQPHPRAHAAPYGVRFGGPAVAPRAAAPGAAARRVGGAGVLGGLLGGAVERCGADLACVPTLVRPGPAAATAACH